MTRIMDYDEWWTTVGRFEQIQRLLEKGWDVEEAEITVDRYNEKFKYAEEYTDYQMLAEEIIGYHNLAQKG